MNADPSPVTTLPESGMSPQTAPSGRVKGLLWTFSDHNDVTIGSDSGCDIVIEGADAVHATLCWEKRENGWGWVLHDDPAPQDTVVNGVPVKAKPLDPRDWIEIAGIRLRYDGNPDEGFRLEEIDAATPVGLRVSVRHVSVKTWKKTLPDGSSGGRASGRFISIAKDTFSKKTLLDDVSFEVAPGRFVAILGPSGGGKTTLIQRLAGFASFEGHIWFNGHELPSKPGFFGWLAAGVRKLLGRSGDPAGEKSALLAQIAYLPQSVEDTLHADMSVETEAETFARIYLGKPLGDGEWKRKFKAVGLDWEELRNRKAKIRDLSGGQKRRLALVLALLRNPQLLLLDEPTAGLDPAAAADVMESLKSLAGQGRTVLCATHVLDNLDSCDEVLILGKNGCRIFHGPPAEAPGKDNWPDFYRKLSSGEAEPVPDREKRPEPVGKELPPPPLAVTQGKAFRGTLRRLLCPGWGAWLLRAGIASGVGAVLAWACKSMFGKGGDQETVCFCMAVAMFWLGLSSTVRSLVAERVPKRCLDRMRGMPLAGYFAAHAVSALVVAAVQALLFVFVVFCWRRNTPFFSGCAAPAFLFILWITAFAGGCAGLALGAGCKTELQAVLLLPVVAIFALFLSKPVLEQNGERPAGALRTVESFMPTLHVQECLYGELTRYRRADPPSNAGNWQRFLVFPAAGYPLLFLPLAMCLQGWRERQWDGR